jgi:cytochrome oxidase Cu insertion factor (SCO1/SenC/PrrC family)
MSEKVRPRINPWSIWVLIAVMFGGILITFSWLRTLERQFDEGKPPEVRPVERLRSDDQGGKQAELFNRDGLLYLVGYFYAGDEVEALAVCRRMQAIRAPFIADRRVKMVGISMAPDLDSPAILNSFALKHGYTGEEWIFLSGNRDRMRKYMNKTFRYPGHAKPDKERKSETDLYARELRVTLVHGGNEDKEAFIRGIYWEGRAKGELRNDKMAESHIRYLLDKDMPVRKESADEQGN